MRVMHATSEIAELIRSGGLSGGKTRTLRDMHDPQEGCCLQESLMNVKETQCTELVEGLTAFTSRFGRSSSGGYFVLDFERDEYIIFNTAVLNFGKYLCQFLV